MFHYTCMNGSLNHVEVAFFRIMQRRVAKHMNDPSGQNISIRIAFEPSEDDADAHQHANGRT
jgi:hypothetical protein